MSRIVRTSKYRHVFGTGAKNEDQYSNLKPSKSAWDTDKVAGNNKFLGLIWESRGGGSFAVLKNDQKGKLPSDLPLVTGHSGSVLDVATSPFNDGIFGSACEDGVARIWTIPAEGLTENLNDPAQNLIGHRRKVGRIVFNPTANNIVATTSNDYTVKVWDIETGQEKLSVPGHVDIIQSTNWNYNGSELVTTSKDKKVRVFDPRSGEIQTEFAGHPGVKGSRAIFLGEKNQLFIVGFSRSSDRCYMIIDPRNSDTKLAKANIDTSSGMLMPFYDNDTCMLFLAGKGDGNIRYYEITDDKPYIHYLSEYKTNKPALGMCMRPKTFCDVSTCEVVNMLKVQNTAVEPISFCVPRKSMSMFQDDIYPNTAGPDPAQDAAAWLGGNNADPIKISLEGGFVAKEVEEFKPAEVVEKVKELTEVEVRAEHEKLKQRVAYLEAELVKRDAKIRELQG